MLLRKAPSCWRLARPPALTPRIPARPARPPPSPLPSPGREFNIVSYTLLLSLIEFKTLVMREQLSDALGLLPGIPAGAWRTAHWRTCTARAALCVAAHSAAACAHPAHQSPPARC